MMTDSKNQNPENSKVPVCKSESLKENVNLCLRTFYLSHHELLVIEFRQVLNENCTGCQTNDCTRIVFVSFRSRTSQHLP